MIPIAAFGADFFAIDDAVSNSGNNPLDAVHATDLMATNSWTSAITGSGSMWDWYTGQILKLPAGTRVWIRFAGGVTSKANMESIVSNLETKVGSRVVGYFLPDEPPQNNVTLETMNLMAAAVRLKAPTKKIWLNTDGALWVGGVSRPFHESVDADIFSIDAYMTTTPSCVWNTREDIVTQVGYMREIFKTRFGSDSAPMTSMGKCLGFIYQAFKSDRGCTPIPSGYDFTYENMKSLMDLVMAEANKGDVTRMRYLGIYGWRPALPGFEIHSRIDADKSETIQATEREVRATTLSVTDYLQSTYGNLSSTPPPGTGTGLTGTYKNSTDYSGGVIATVYNELISKSFNGTASPAPGVNPQFSAEWNGFVEAPTTGNYYFSTLSDDGVRFYLTKDGVESTLIDNWTDHGQTQNDSSVQALTAGTKYPIRLRYYNKYAGGVINLRWKVPSATTYEIIPINRLYAATVLPTLPSSLNLIAGEVRTLTLENAGGATISSIKSSNPDAAIVYPPAPAFPIALWAYDQPGEDDITAVLTVESNGKAKIINMGFSHLITDAHVDSPSTDTALADTCAGLGVKVIWCLDRGGSWTDAYDDTTDGPTLATWVNAVKAKSASGGYMLFDEPDDYAGENGLRYEHAVQIHAKIKANDNNAARPTIGAYTTFMIRSDIPAGWKAEALQYANLCDIQTFSYYLHWNNNTVETYRTHLANWKTTNSSKAIGAFYPGWWGPFANTTIAQPTLEQMRAGMEEALAVSGYNWMGCWAWDGHESDNTTHANMFQIRDDQTNMVPKVKYVNLRQKQLPKTSTTVDIKGMAAGTSTLSILLSTGLTLTVTANVIDPPSTTVTAQGKIGLKGQVSVGTGQIIEIQGTIDASGLAGLTITRTLSVTSGKIPISGNIVLTTASGNKIDVSGSVPFTGEIYILSKGADVHFTKNDSYRPVEIFVD